MLIALDGEPAPFATQFFTDDYDDGPGFDDDDGPGASVAVEAGEQDLLAATQGQTRRVKPEAVNYAKRAKRVDVRKLKENIWKGLDIIAPTAEEHEDAMVNMAFVTWNGRALIRLSLQDTDDQPPTDPDDGRSFTTVISGLHRAYPKDKMDEISTSFCFICLLHLANERGLKLEVDGKDEDEDAATMETEVEEKKVGNLWDLKVRLSSLAISVCCERCFCRYTETRTQPLHHSDCLWLGDRHHDRVYYTYLCCTCRLAALGYHSLTRYLLYRFFPSHLFIHGLAACMSAKSAINWCIVQT